MDMDKLTVALAREIGRDAKQVANVITLLDDGATIPFIARYRKEKHGSMDDQLLRQLSDRLSYLRNLEGRKEEIRTAIENQGKLTEELSQAIDNAATLAEAQAAVQSLPNGQVETEAFAQGDHNYGNADPAIAAQLDETLCTVTAAFLVQQLK